MAALCQASVVYHRSVREVTNLGRYSANPNFSEIVDTAKAAGAHDFISGCRKRYVG
jgi:ABC-type bacteriocin/lantibiotic exporter with double-glycine peptidase domain